MHMHGSYYRIEATGDGQRDERYSPEMRPVVATHLMTPGTTMETTWTPAEPGHWLFHCHLMGHVEYAHSLSALQEHNQTTQHTHSGMVGLVMALEVEGKPRVKHAAYRQPRKLTLYIQERTAKPLQIGLRLVDQGRSVETGKLIGPPIVLYRGEPAEITVINRMSEPTAIHWHGMELESYYDGVPGFTGTGKHVTPMIVPGGKFVARMTPPRSGTFIYHTHWHDIEQLRGGLNGPLLVVDKEMYRPESDQSFVAGFGTNDEHPLIVNGEHEPTALEWRAGGRYHLRLINIGPNIPVRFTMQSLGQKLQWRVVGKDGMTLPAVQARTTDATQVLAVGETYDIEMKVDSVDQLKLVTEFVPGAVPVKMDVVQIPIHVR